MGYFLMAITVKSDSLQSFLSCCYDKLEKISLCTKVLVCDQGPNNRSILHKLENVSVENPYIFNNRKKVFVIYDTPRLLKNIKNNFMKSSYKYKDVDIKWEYIADFYNTDKIMSTRKAPMLTDKYTNVPPFTAVRVNLAVQTLSNSIPTGTNILCTLSHLSGEASSTAEFIETVDQLFNAFSSANIASSHKYKNSLNYNSGHIPFLTSCLTFLLNIITQKDTTMPCIVDWQISICCL